MKQDKTGKETNSISFTVLRERTHPYRTFLFFALFGSSILFLALVFMFIVWVTHNDPILNFHLPKAFILSTIILLFSSYTASLSHRYYREDNAQNLLLSLSSTLLFSGIFVILQVIGWKSMYQSGFYIDGDAGITFLYTITGLHFLHVGAGMIYLFYLSLKVFDIWRDPVRSLLYFSNHFEGVRLELFSTYWHFIDGLWLFLFLTFLFTL